MVNISNVSPIIVLLIIMMLCGVAGGYVNYIFNLIDKSINGNGMFPQLTAGPFHFIFIGVVSVFIVPLFLSLVQSELLKQTLSGGEASIIDYFIYAGFCLIAAIYSRAFIQTISSRVLALASHASRVANETEEKQGKLTTEIDELAEVVGSNVDTTAEILDLEAAGEHTRQANLTDDQRRVLSALKAKPYLSRTLKGISEDSGLNRNKTLEVLGQLLEDRLAREKISEKTGNTLYEITSKGANFLIRQ
jgi:hypothetical protein